jgi:2,3-diketo-5-methylthiopentyl-1-phosphate enolase
VPEETPAVRRKHVGKVVAVYEVPDYEMCVPKEVEERSYIVQIAYPFINIGIQIPMLLSTVIGNISMAGKLKLLDLSFPKQFLAAQKGAKFGIAGVRKLLNVPVRPLVNNMIKPCTGISPDVGAKLFYQAAVGGCDMVKDDELQGDTDFSPLAERVKKFMAMEKKAYDETGERTIYTVNVTDRPDRMLEKAKRAVELGANGLMVNYLTVGISALTMLADDPDLPVPILAHLDFAGVMYESYFSGISSHLVLGKLPRIAGADVVVYPNPYGKFEFMREKHLRIALAHRMELQNIKPVWPMPGGGVHTGMVGALTAELGYDYILGVGGAVHGHPLGAISGAKAMRQAVDATVAGIPLRQAAESHEELKVAIDSWGIQGEEEKELFSMK